MTHSKNNKSVDLSVLSELDFAPNWDKEREKPENKRINKPRQNSRDRGRKDYKKKIETTFITKYKITINADSSILTILKNKIRKTGLTYSLDEISSAISCDFSRLQVKIEPLENDKMTFYHTVFDGTVFDTKERAIEHIIKNGMMSIADVVCDDDVKPKGNYTTILKCPKTDKLFPPKSFHEFENIIKEHLAKEKICLNYQNFADQLILIDDKSIIDGWKEKPLEKTLYILKKSIVSNKTFSTIDSLKKYIDRVGSDKIIKTIKSITINKNKSLKLDEHLKNYVDNYMKSTNKWKKDLFFSILINLKKSNFSIFKFGQKKYLYACGIKPKSIDLKLLSSNCIKIIKLITVHKSIKKIEILNNMNDEKLKKDFILIELKWLLSEGYIKEFSDGTITVN